MTRTINAATADQATSVMRSNLQTPARRRTAAGGTLLFGALIIASLAWGWLHRGRLPSAESGWGYAFGIVGALSMLALLAYPMRKHAPFMRKMGTVGFFFRTHMALGLIGPTFILYHANFGLGALNSNVSLWSMLLVAGSGLVGRYIYAKTHKGLYGVRAEIRDLSAEARQFRDLMNTEVAPQLAARFDNLERQAFFEPNTMGSAAAKAFVVTASARRLHAALRRDLRRKLRRSAQGSARQTALRSHLDFCRRYFRRVEQAAELGFYERLFAAWHILHLPLFILLILTAIVHVVAVHHY
ncbi:MAG: pyridine nucleotide-disulfide oxidoreductase [Parvularculaceae bacterium]|nr:pyridine nucleotide-disulfide oxidoreductase [Parvularculaceae bacterium]